MVLDLRQRAGTPSGSEVTEVTSAMAEPKKGGGRRANEASLHCRMRMDKYIDPNK